MRPLALPGHHVTRLINRKASALILGRELQLTVDAAGTPAVYEVYNALTLRRNVKLCRHGRADQQENPHVFNIELLDVDTCKLRDVTPVQSYAAGYRTTDELLEDWRRRRRRLDVTMDVHVHRFTIVDARYLHSKVHLAYTVDPAQAVREGGEAPTDGELAAYSREAHNRDALIRRARRQAMPLDERVRELAARAADGDSEARRAMFVIEQKVAQAEERRARKRQEQAA